MSDWIHFEKDPAQMGREKQKAKQLRESQWWKNILAQGVCHYCGKKFPPEELTMDHVVPLARGGKSTKGNIVPCCKECNNQKKYLTPVEIMFEKLKNEKQ